MPRKTKRTSTLAGRDTYHVLGPAGEELAVKGEAAHAMTTAQERAMRNFADTATLTVERRSLFGPPAELYRVVRTEDGAILTYTIEPVD